jgi:hypothetical protein
VHVSRDGSRDQAKGVVTTTTEGDAPAAMGAASLLPETAGSLEQPGATVGANSTFGFQCSSISGVERDVEMEMPSLALSTAAPGAGAGGDLVPQVGSKPGTYKHLQQEVQRQVLDPQDVETEQQSSQSQLLQQQALVEGVVQGLKDFLRASGLDQAIEVSYLKKGTEWQQNTRSQETAATAAAGDDASGVGDDQAGSCAAGRGVREGNAGGVQGVGLVDGLVDTEIQQMVGLGAQQGMLSLSYKQCTLR